MLELRDYQQDLFEKIVRGWGIHNNVLAVMATGGGKTVLFSKLIQVLGQDVPHKNKLILVHRQELVMQICVTLAKFKVSHRIYATSKVVKLICAAEVREVGTALYYDSNAPVAVCSVPTVKSRGLDGFLRNVSHGVIDEAHHVLKDNIWGQVTDMFQGVKWLGVTATPLRADGKGLGAHSDGIFESMVVGPKGRLLIDRGYLSEYRVMAPAPEVDLAQVKRSVATGDFNKNDLREAMATAQVAITGSVVDVWHKYASGKRTVVFAINIDEAVALEKAFVASGVSAAAVSSKTDDTLRGSLIRQFSTGGIMVLINVDLFGEGFDVPAIEVVQMVRPTLSYALFCQQFGRALRIMEGKGKALIIDHVGNVMRHAVKYGMPDIFDKWSLDARSKRKNREDVGEIPYKTCPECLAVYPAYTDCPYCGPLPKEPAAERTLEVVEGDLIELDNELLKALSDQKEIIDEGNGEHCARLEAKYMPRIGVLAGLKRHKADQLSQGYLRYTIDCFGGAEHISPLTDSGAMKVFYYRFGTDILSAQSLKAKDADELTIKIWRYLDEGTI